MARKSVLFLTGIGLLFLLVPTVAADGYWFPMVLNGTLNAPLFSLQYYHKVETTQNSREKFEYNWTTGIVAINYYVFTEANFLNWSVGLPSSAHATIENITAGFDMFITNGANQTWVFVWYNPSITSTQLVGRYERYKWVEVDGFLPGFPWAAVLLGAVSALTLSLILRRKIRKN
ncbi:MAG: hypothetical protein ACFE9D_09110 [Promethearchaeota archaeon]